MGYVITLCIGGVCNGLLYQQELISREGIGQKDENLIHAGTAGGVWETPLSCSEANVFAADADVEHSEELSVYF